MSGTLSNQASEDVPPSTTEQVNRIAGKLLTVGWTHSVGIRPDILEGEEQELPVIGVHLAACRTPEMLLTRLNGNSRVLARSIFVILSVCFLFALDLKSEFKRFKIV